MTIEDWLEEHLNPETEIYHFQPSEMLFQIVDNGDSLLDTHAVVVPRQYYEAEGSIFDDEFVVDTFDWPELGTGTFEPVDPLPAEELHAQLLQLGMTPFQLQENG